MNVNQFNALIEQAREKNASFDVTDRVLGNPTPKQAGVRESMNVAMEAIKAGMITEDWRMIAEAFALLESAGGRVLA